MFDVNGGYRQLVECNPISKVLTGDWQLHVSQDFKKGWSNKVLKLMVIELKATSILDTAAMLILATLTSPTDALFAGKAFMTA